MVRRRESIWFEPCINLVVGIMKKVGEEVEGHSGEDRKGGYGELEGVDKEVEAGSG